MNRYARDHTDAYRGPKVSRVELSEKHIALRIVLAVVCLLVGVGTLVFTFLQFVRTESGWQEISVDSDAALGCSADFQLYYELGAGEESARTEKQRLASLYGELCSFAWQQFTNDQSIDGVNNMRAINDSPNTVLTVDPVLYDAFRMLEDAGSRYLYCAPLYELQETLCTAESDSAAKETDPAYSEELAGYVSDVLGFIGSSDEISLELLGDDQVCLHVSEAYQSFAEENGIRNYLDFFAIRNAFIIDYLADHLIAEQFTDGTISSLDGYTRSLDEGKSALTLQIYDEADGTVYAAAKAEVNGMDSVVTLRSFPLTESDSTRYYVYQSGEIRSPWLSEENGNSCCAVSSLTGCSGDGSCSSLVCALLPVWLQDTLEPAAVSSLRNDGVYAVYCRDSVVYSDFPEAEFSELYDQNGKTYTVETIP